MVEEDGQGKSADRTTEFEDARLQLARLRADGELPLRKVWLQLAELVSSTLNVERVGIWVLFDDDAAIRCRYLLQRSAGQVFEGAVLREQDFPSYFAAMRERRTIVVDDALGSPLTQELRAAYLQPLGVTSMIDVPIYVSGRIVGVVCHEHVGPMRQWRRAECSFADAVADTAARLYLEYERHNAATALQQYQRDVMELRRMEAVGRVAAGMAHDFRGILGAAMGFAELIRTTPDISPQIERYSGRAMEALERGLKLTEEIMRLGTDEAGVPSVFDVCAAIDSIVPMFRVLLGDGVALKLLYKRPVSRVFMDVSQLERALLNLVMNARDAMPAGGDLTIAVEETAADSSPQDEQNKKENATFVAIAVTDTGVGMDADTRAKALRPFYTTKGDKGTGLGLAIVDQIVARAGGSMCIDSAPGRGTTVRLCVPRIGLPRD